MKDESLASFQWCLLRIAHNYPLLLTNKKLSLPDKTINLTAYLIYSEGISKRMEWVSKQICRLSCRNEEVGHSRKQESFFQADLEGQAHYFKQQA